MRPLSLVPFALVAIAGISSAQTPCGTTVWDLTAGQTIDVGSVTVSNDLDNIYITYTLDYQNAACPDGAVDAVFGTLHVWVGNDPLNVPAQGGSPVNCPNGAPTPGQFCQSAGGRCADASGLTTYTFTLPFNDIGLVNVSNANDLCNENLYVFTHAEVNYLDCEGNPTGEGDTAFGGPIAGNCNRWFFYGEYPVCCDFGPPSGVPFCQTAYAKGGYVWTTQRRSNPENLPSLRLTMNRWGWAINLTAPGITTYEIWAGAGLNNTNNGELVGELTLDWDGTNLDFCYQLNAGYTMEELHLYAGDPSPTTIAPGQYGYIQEFDPAANSWCDRVPLADTNGTGGVWVVAHAVVCRPE